MVGLRTFQSSLVCTTSETSLISLCVNEIYMVKLIILKKNKAVLRNWGKNYLGFRLLSFFAA